MASLETTPHREAFLDRVLDPPSYGFKRDGVLYVPTHREIFREFLHRLNFIRDKKNWLPAWGWFVSLILAVPLFYFFAFHFSIWLVPVGFVYSMVCLGSHGTLWLHRYCTHRGYKFSGEFPKFVCRNLVIKIIPEEIYAVSHHVHHAISEQPGDPYNVYGGWLYCFLADVNHQTMRKDLTRDEYARLCKLMNHTGMKLNSYEQFQKWGSLCHPARTIAHYVLNWAFWASVFYFIGGLPLALVIFGSAAVWAIGVRTYNYDGHGGGKDKKRDGVDFNRKDLSINQLWPGYVAGEWHNNHHLYPNAARSGFLPYQLDLPWIFIRCYSAIGGISSYRDYKKEFYEHHYLPYIAGKAEIPEAPILDELQEGSEFLSEPIPTLER